MIALWYENYMKHIAMFNEVTNPKKPPHYFCMLQNCCFLYSWCCYAHVNLDRFNITRHESNYSFIITKQFIKILMWSELTEFAQKESRN